MSQLGRCSAGRPWSSAAKFAERVFAGSERWTSGIDVNAEWHGGDENISRGPPELYPLLSERRHHLLHFRLITVALLAPRYAS